MTAVSGTPLEVRYASRRGLLPSAKADRGTLTLFVPTARRVAQGTRLRLRNHLRRRRRAFRARGAALNRTQASSAAMAWAASWRTSPGTTTAGRGNDRVCARRPLALGTARASASPCARAASSRWRRIDIVGRVPGFVADGRVRRLPPSSRGSYKEGEPVWLKVERGLFGLGGTWLEARVIWKGAKGEERGWACASRATSQVRPRPFNACWSTASER